ncbi:hypothetical protein D3C80_1294440 [compost metagenome]
MKASESVISSSGLLVRMASEAARRGITPMPVASTSPSSRKHSLAAQISSSARL